MVVLSSRIEIAKSYYTSMAEKRIEDLASQLASDVIVKSPLGVIEGKEAVVAAAGHFASVIKNLDIKNGFLNRDKVALIIDFSCQSPFGNFPAVSFLTFNDENKIVKIELFYDVAPFQKDEEFRV